MLLVDRRFEQEFARRLRRELDSIDIPSRPFAPAVPRRLPLRSFLLAATIAVGLSAAVAGAVSGAVTGNPDPRTLVQRIFQGEGDEGPATSLLPSPESPPAKAAVPVKHSPAAIPTQKPEPGEATPLPNHRESPEPHESEPSDSGRASSTRTSSPPPSPPHEDIPSG
jgi:hypothetical protein